MKFSSVFLVKSIFVPGLRGGPGMQLKQTLDQQNHPGIESKPSPLGITCKLNGRTFLIPWHKVDCAVILEEESLKDVKSA